jgi:hypothetical protein
MGFVWRNGETAVTIDEARKLADLWVAAWNVHDLDQIMNHYEEGVEPNFASCRPALRDI